MLHSLLVTIALLVSAPQEGAPQDGGARTMPDHTAAPTAEQARQWGEHRSLKLLYAGSPGGSREKVFLEFLRCWFDEVGVVGLNDLDAAAAEPYDVVIADWRSYYGNDGYPERGAEGSRITAQLGSDFTRPVVTMSYVAARVRRGKLDWL